MKTPAKYIRLWIYKSFNEDVYDGVNRTGLCGFLFFSGRFRLWRLFQKRMELSDMIKCFPELMKHKPDGTTHFGYWWPKDDYEVRQEIIDMSIKELQNDTK